MILEQRRSAGWVDSCSARLCEPLLIAGSAACHTARDFVMLCIDTGSIDKASIDIMEEYSSSTSITGM